MINSNISLIGCSKKKIKADKNITNIEPIRDDWFIPAFTFRESVNSIANINPSDFKDGDVFFDVGTNSTYVCVSNSFEQIGGLSDTDDHGTKDENLEIMKVSCCNCGAPLHMKSRYDNNIKCEYCGSIFAVK